MSKCILISILLAVASGTAYAEEEDSTVFAGISMTYAQGMTPDGFLVKSLGYKETDPDWLKIEEVLIETQSSMAADMAEVLKQHKACDDGAWDTNPWETAEMIDAPSKRIMKLHFLKAQTTLSDEQFSALADWVETHKTKTNYRWLTDMQDPGREVSGMCERMFPQGGET